MKNKVLKILGIISLLALLVAIAYLIYNNERLKEIINRQDELIIEAGKKDSEFMKRAKNYKDSIKVFTDKISFIVNGKEISSSQFVLLYDQLRDKNDSIKDELNKISRKYVRAEEEYGFKIDYRQTDSTYTTTVIPYTRADSAQITFEYFKDRIKRNKKGWTINTTGPEDLKKITKELQNSLKGAKAIVDSAESLEKKFRAKKDSISN